MTRPPGRRLLLRMLAVGGCLWALANLLSAYVAANAGLTDLIWKQPDRDGAFERTVGGERVDTHDVQGRHVAPATSQGTIVLVHGYNGSIDSEPLVALARRLQDEGYGILAIDLGYRDGRHRYTGGHREADDIIAAVAWLRARDEPLTAVWGFSAGAHAALVAATRSPGLPAIVADSPFADAAAQIQRTAASMWHLPPASFFLAPIALNIFSGDRPVDVLDLDWLDTPALIFSGLDDDTVPPADAPALGVHTRGEVVTLPVGHTQGVIDAPDDYLEHGLRFLRSQPAPTST